MIPDHVECSATTHSPNEDKIFLTHRLAGQDSALCMPVSQTLDCYSKLSELKGQ